MGTTYNETPKAFDQQHPMDEWTPKGICKFVYASCPLSFQALFIFIFPFRFCLFSLPCPSSRKLSWAIYERFMNRCLFLYVIIWTNVHSNLTTARPKHAQLTYVVVGCETALSSSSRWLKKQWYPCFLASSCFPPSRRFVIFISDLVSHASLGLSIIHKHFMNPLWTNGDWFSRSSF